METITRTVYGLFRCQPCSDEGACGEWPDELPPLCMSDEDDYWPTCSCCGERGELVAPLVLLTS
jgi:hypothetical protein